MVKKFVIDSFHKYIEKYYQLKGRSRVDNHHVITVAAVVAPDFIHCVPDNKGRLHQHFYIIVNQILEGDANLVDNNTVFVAVHYGDKEGMEDQIKGLEPGKPIEIRGKFIPSSEAYKSEDNPGYPVLHFTHHPIGYIVYDGVKYE